MIRRLKHFFLHDWSFWMRTGKIEYVSYPWTKPGCYAHTLEEQERRCAQCGLIERRYL